MNRRIRLLLSAAVASLCLAGSIASPANATAVPAWRVSVSSYPTNFPPEYSLNLGRLPEYEVMLTNVGSAPSTGPISIVDQLPDGVTEHGSGQVSPEATITKQIDPGDTSAVQIPVDVSLASGSEVVNTVTISGGGAAPASAHTTTRIDSTIPAFDLLDLSGSVSNDEGLPATQAGSHPFQFSFDFGLPAKQIGALPGAGELLGVEGGLRDQITVFPKGMVVDPSATPTRCTEVEFETGKCPDSSVVGIIHAYISVVGDSFVGPAGAPLYNMVPGAGEAAQIGFNPVGAGIYLHVSGGVRAGDYSIRASVNDTLAIFGAPIFGARVQLWGDPSSPEHEMARGECLGGTPGTLCPVPPQSTPFLTIPTACGATQSLEVDVDSWGNPGVFHGRSTPLTDRDENETGVTGCNALSFEPTIEARPTTSVADAPSGLDFDLHVPQSNDLNTLATPHLRKAVVSLPEGLVLNPASANGLDACSPAQVGIEASNGVPNGHPVACPDASKIGAVEVDTSLVENPLIGAVYVAKPYDNPFDSLLAIYVTVDDPQTGVLVKLAGEVRSDPSTGQLTATFDENPQLPFDDFKVHFFGGASAALRTPATCGEYSTTTELTPWSAPDSGPPATPHDDYAITQGPGGACANTSAEAPNSPSFESGSASAVAGHYAPYVFHLRRGDGTQQFKAISLTTPPGLTAKLAGTEQCSEAALAAAAAKSGRQELQGPSCSASSRVGTVSVSAGAGPAPFHTPGTVYLAGPYEGAPISLAIVTPAIAGPYDLGTVVVRSALYLDPSSGKITAVSDPVPEILQGIPLDVRSIDLSLDRPEFTLNGTSCDPSAVEGQLTSTLGQIAPLSSRFQLAECARLGFKPKLGIRLLGGTKRGAHPALKATLTMPAGGANIAKASVALPHSEFLDQAHIGTVCTRVQFAQGDGNGSACPPGSVYGHAVARSPLVDYALEGPAILRSSSHELPDLVVALHGPSYQPVQVDTVGRIDSIKGGIRTTFEGVPDLPVSSFVLSMRGAKKGLLQNSTNICKGTYAAIGEFDAQNGRTSELMPELRNPKCGKARRHRKHHRHAAR